MFDQIKIEIDQLISTNQLKEFHARISRGSGFIEIRGRKLLDFTNWDVLALNENKKFTRAVQQEIESSGFGSSAPRLSSGTTLSHLSCEKRIAQFLGTPSSLLFSSKNQAFLSLITAVAAEGDLIFFDEQLQSPVADAAYLMNSSAVPFNSSNLSALDSELQKVKNLRRKFIFVESVSPLSGRRLDLKALYEIAKRHDAQVVVDESFALASEGMRGAGVLEDTMLTKDVFCIVGSLAHGIPCYGAFLAGNALLINYVLQRSKTFAFEPALPASVSSGVEAALDIIELAAGDRAKLSLTTADFRLKLASSGFLDGKQSDSPIVSVMVGTTKKARELSNVLYSKGFLVDVVSLQTSLTDIGLLRMIVSVNHNKESLDSLVVALTDVCNKMGED